MTRSITSTIAFGLCATLAAALGGCGPDYSPDTYNAAAVQQANKVDTGIVIGFREVRISADGTVGAVTGGAAGGILGAQANSPTVPTALAALGGTVVGGVVGVTIEHATGDTTGWEYIVRQPKGDLISVTQREKTPIAIGQRVLVIEGKQARIVPDYATTYDQPPDPKADEKHEQEKAKDAAPAVTPAPPATPIATPPASSTDAKAGAAPAVQPTDQNKTPSDATTPASAPPPAAPGTPPITPAAAGSGGDAPPPS